MNPNDPHAGTPVASLGVPVEDARALVILLHGRGDTPEGILTLARYVPVDDLIWWAPAAQNNTWYPYSFMAPFEQNQPHLDSALKRIDALMDQAAEAEFEPENIVLAGFSQGACLSLEWTARNPGRVHSVVAFSGGLIGPAGTTFDYPERLDGTPVFLGCSDTDPHIPLARVEESATVLAAMGADVEKRIYPNMPHTVNEDELQWFNEHMWDVVMGD